MVWCISVAFVFHTSNMNCGAPQARLRDRQTEFVLWDKWRGGKVLALNDEDHGLESPFPIRSL